ncbi:MAG: ATP synthase F1 subunit epsilon [Saprospiraceae bacterium]
MKLVVLTPEKEYFNGEITGINVPGIAGGFEILKGHAPIVSALTSGTVKVTKAEGGNENIMITGGFIEVLNNEVSVLASGIVTQE